MAIINDLERCFGKTAFPTWHYWCCEQPCTFNRGSPVTFLLGIWPTTVHVTVWHSTLLPRDIQIKCPRHTLWQGCSFFWTSHSCLSQCWDWAQAASGTLLRACLENGALRNPRHVWRNRTDVVSLLLCQQGRPQPLQLIGAVGRLVHPVSLLEQLKKFFHGNPGVGWAP